MEKDVLRDKKGHIWIGFIFDSHIFSIKFLGERKRCVDILWMNLILFAKKNSFL